MGSAWTTLSHAYEKSLLLQCKSQNVKQSNIADRGIVVPPRQITPFSNKSCLPQITAERRLHRFIRRIKEWRLNPRPQLLKKLRRDEKWVTHRWPELTEPAVAWNVSALHTKVQQYERERGAADQASRLQAITESDTRIFTWLKRPNTTGPNSSLDDALPLDPALQVEHLQTQWNKIWLQEPMANWEKVKILVPSKSEVHFNLPKATTLWKLEQAAKGKAAGPDGWHGSNFAKLSPQAFQSLAVLWEKCLEIGKFPQVWAHARTVFIDKPNGDGKRPLSIAAICWRLVASAAVTDLKTWIQSWADDSLCGGCLSAEPMNCTFVCIESIINSVINTIRLSKV